MPTNHSPRIPERRSKTGLTQANESPSETGLSPALRESHPTCHCEERVPERRGNLGLTDSPQTPANSADDTQPLDEPGATWLSTGLDGAAWDTSGCQGVPADREADPVAITAIPPKDKGGHWVQWDITPLARYWVEHPGRNFGVLLRACAEDPGTVSFYSSQAAREDPASTRGGRCVAWHPILICWP